MRIRRRARVWCTLATILGTWPAGGGWVSANEPAELPPIVIAAEIAGPELPPAGPVVPVAATELPAEPPPPVPSQLLQEVADLPAPAAPVGEVVGGWRPLPGVANLPIPARPLVTSTGFSEEPPMVAGAAAPEPGPVELTVPRKLPAAGAEPVEMVKIVDAPHAPHYGPPPVPREQARVTLPPYIIDPPDVLLIESTQKLPDQPIRGQHLIRPDGTVGLGIYGSVYVAGMTLDQAREATRIKDFEIRNLAVDVAAYNSKYYYVISDGGGFGEQVTRFPVTGNETVLDAISQIGGLGAVSSKKHIWVARTTGGHHHQQTLPVDWVGITHGRTETNYQVMPNDRVYVKAKPIVTFDTALGRILSPIERLFGVTLLGANTVNQISGRGLNNNNNSGN